MKKLAAKNITKAGNVTSFTTTSASKFHKRLAVRPTKTKTFLGPVKDLEEYVKPDWWKVIFNSIYLKTDADVVDDHEVTKKEIDLFLNYLNLKEEDHILDLCCGQGRHSLELARRGFKYVNGLDRSHYLIQKVKKQALKERLPVRFKEGDARKIPYPADAFDAVMILGNSFGYFQTIEDDIKVLKEVMRILKPSGQLVIDVANGDFLRDNYQPRSWEWIDKNLFVCRERSLSKDKSSLVSREVVTHVMKGVIADQFYSERLYSLENLKELLGLAGFSDISVRGFFSPDSKRAQDLGMMQQRIIITALVCKDWASPKKKKEQPKHVIVLLGDPNKYDCIKPTKFFGNDDLVTVNLMKKALDELSDYKFFYFDNHNTIIHELLRRKDKIKLVFNLCDNGFENDPRKELHIPSLLEVLSVPYTGSGPQCLSYCYDKSLVRGIAQEMSIPVPDAFFIKSEDSFYDIPIEFPVIVKPNFGDSSFGITQNSVVYNTESLIKSLAEIRKKFGYEKPILIEEFLTGKDLSVGIIGNPPESYKVLPIIEEDFSTLPDDLPKICGYEAKWLPDSPYGKVTSIPANLEENLENFIIECCLKLFDRLECRDYCRFDWRLNKHGQPKILEVNPNPGWCWDGHLAKMAQLANLSYKDMLRELIHAAEQRIERLEYRVNGS